MSAPREHVEAVAKAIRDHLGAGWNSQSLAKDILNSTDPAVHAALLDALLRAGVLDPEASGGPIEPEGKRRYVTEWERR